jgi:hypothetical protein
MMDQSLRTRTNLEALEVPATEKRARKKKGKGRQESVG